MQALATVERCQLLPTPCPLSEGAWTTGIPSSEEGAQSGGIGRQRVTRAWTRFVGLLVALRSHVRDERTAFEWHAAVWPLAGT